MDDVCLLCCCPFFFFFLPHSATNDISIPGSPFRSTRLKQCYCNYLGESQGLLSPSWVHFRSNYASLFLHLSSSKVLPSHLLAYVYIFLSRPPLTVKLATSSSSLLPSRVRSRVLTLDSFQICSLWGWKAVMRAKKNSLALSLTTSHVFQMKPNENSILFLGLPSLPPSHRSSRCVSLLVQLLCL